MVSLMFSLKQRDNFTYLYIYIYISVQCYEMHNIRLLQLNVGIINRVYLRSQASSAT